MFSSSRVVPLLVVLVAQYQVLLPAAAAAAAAAGAGGAQQQQAGAYLAKNNAKFKQLLTAVSVDDKALEAMKGILLVPSDAAIEAFAKSMGMSVQQLLSNPLLVDQTTAYHYVPGVKVTKGLLPRMPIISRTAEPSWVIRFFKDPKTNRARLLDMQGNFVPLDQKPVVIDGLTIVPVDKVLMSGSYFKSFEDALRIHGQFGKANDLFKRAGGLGSTASEGTVFVPVDKAFDTSKVSVSALSQPDSRRVLQYHATAATSPVAQLQAGTKPTLLAGHNVKVDATYSGELKEPWRSGKTVKKPVVSVTDEAGNKADVTLFNIWAGKGVIHGIDKVLQPSAVATSTEKGAAQPSRSAPNAKSSGRKLLQEPGRYTPSWNQSPNPASSLLATNTVGAAYSAAAAAQNVEEGIPENGFGLGDSWTDWETNGR